MQPRFSNQLSALERAQRQLQGKRVTVPSGSAGKQSGSRNRTDKDDLDAYLSKLNKKVSGKQEKSTLSDDLSDLSISSEDGDGGRDKPSSLLASRFLKKSQSQTLDESGKTRRKDEVLSSTTTLKKSATTPNFMNRSAPVHASAALQKAAELGAKFAKQKKHSVDNLLDSESDFDISLSDDSSDLQMPKSKPRANVTGASKEKVHAHEAKNKSSMFSHLQDSDDDEPKRDASRFLKKSNKPSFYVSESDDEDGRDRNKFLKKPASSKPPLADPAQSVPEEASGSRFLKKSAKKQDVPPSKVKTNADNDTDLSQGFPRGNKTSTPKKASSDSQTSKLSRTAPGGPTFGLDSDEEDLEDFIKNLSPSSSPDIPPIREFRTTNNEGPARIKEAEQQVAPRQPMEKAAHSRRPATPGVKKALEARDALESPSVDSELAEEVDISIATQSVDDEEDNDFFGGISTNIMQLEDLEPVGVNALKAKVKPPSRPKSSAAESFQEDIPDEISEQDSIREDVFAGLQTIDDLLARQAPRKEHKRPPKEDSYKSDFESADEIGTDVEPSVSEAVSEIGEALGRSGSKTPGEVYAEDTFESNTDSQSETRTSTRTVPDSHSDVYTSDEDTRRRLASHSQRTSSGSRSSRTKKSRSYSDDYDSHSRRTDSDAEDLSTDDGDRTRTESVTHSRSYTSYTETRTVTRSETTPRKGKRRGRRKEKSKDAAVQADGAISATHRWLRDLDLSALGTVTGIDPTPVAMHVINPQALEALTSYSPSVLAMNQMFLSQLRHTQQTVRASLQLHRSMIENIETDFSYTTLDDTKEYIRRHRRPKLTMEQALEEVKRETEEGYR